MAEDDEIRSGETDDEQDKHTEDEGYSAEDAAQDAVVDGEASGKFTKLIAEGENKYKITGMYKNWFLDYASYVILDRAVPHILDGLKPVQRRILHTMKLMDDGRFNKVANIAGQTMQFHPHGDASIMDALVQMGQKNLLIDCQGNWGNTVTGDDAAAGRYIEARLSNFANDVVFNPKTTEWMKSYDGRNREPVTLPVKFPLLLQQGADGIAVGLNCKVLPHNFNELIDAAVAYLQGKDFQLYPDFPSGGMIDVSRYNDGKRGGVVKVRAKIARVDKKTIEITEIPYGKNSKDIIKSIKAAYDKGKIKIKRADDDSAKNADIVITLNSDVSPDKTIDALYAFTDCEVSISPNTCVIKDNKPQFLTVTEVLKVNADRTKELLKQELEIKLQELQDTWHYLSLEKIFFEEKKYKLLEKDSKSWESQLSEIHKAMLAYQERLQQPITMEDIQKLVEKPVRKISKFDVKECNAKIAKAESEMKGIKKHLNSLTQFTIDYYLALKKKYGENFPRRTEIANFETIQATKVAVSNAKLYANYAEGFVGMQLKKDENAQFICDCSDIDDIIVFLKSGKYIVTKISDKTFVGKDIIHAGVFVKNDVRTIYNAIYRDGKNGSCFVKRFAVPAVTRDKEYDLTQGKADSTVLWFTANPNGEAETVKVMLRPRPKLKKLIFDYDFAQLAVKGRGSRGNILTKNAVTKVLLRSAGASTLGDKPLWFDKDINRLNEDNHGLYLGKFHEGDMILAVYKDGTYCTTNFDLTNHYQGEILRIEKMNPEKVFAAVYYDGETKKFYIKRFCFEVNNNPTNIFISEAEGSYLERLTDKPGTKAIVQFLVKQKTGRGKKAVETTKEENEIVDIDQFVEKKGWKAKGRKLTGVEVEKVGLIEPVELDEDMPEPEETDVPEETASEEEPDTPEDIPDDTPEQPGDNQPSDDNGDPTLF
ncbi:MAG: DNA gyrase/topoisomerase IV subunit A [Bacteroidales bacterium]|jgi:topoisomerase-4 subunit A|nr:DNA gyrase/topoisomerase IV subunit A [Bacteroidales bacterium]MCI1733273.1 DNA gyrase/topoisomerase IV subunit A [Bacteroidales bacterium]